MFPALSGNFNISRATSEFPIQANQLERHVLHRLRTQCKMLRRRNHNKYHWLVRECESACRRLVAGTLHVSWDTGEVRGRWFQQWIRSALQTSSESRTPEKFKDERCRGVIRGWFSASWHEYQIMKIVKAVQAHENALANVTAEPYVSNVPTEATLSHLGTRESLCRTVSTLPHHCAMSQQCALVSLLVGRGSVRGMAHRPDSRCFFCFP